MIILVLLVWLIFYGVKGFRLKNRTIGVMQAVVVFFGIITIVMSYNYFENSFIKYTVFIYLLYSLIDYIVSFQNIHLPKLPYMSGVHIITEEIEIKYFVLKPLILLVANIFLAFKKMSFMKMSDNIEVDIKTDDKVKISVKF